MSSISAPEPRILLVDCDMFYVQVARLEDPDGAGKEPLLLVGGSATGRGVVTSASYEVREFGVRSGMPTSQALRLCPDAVVAPVRREACSTRSRAVRKALERLSPVVEAASIDEFYLDLTGTERMLGEESFEETAWRIRNEVLEESKISVSIGGGTRKLIAKLAAGRAKPAGVHIVDGGRELDFMRELELRRIPGIGPSLMETLSSRGLVTVEDALRLDLDWLERWLGTGRGRWLYHRIRGEDSRAVDPGAGRKSVSSERTFSRDLTDDVELERHVMKQAISAGKGLRSGGWSARTVTVKIRDADFTTRQASHTVPQPIRSDSAIFSVARGLFRELRLRRRYGVRLLGVGLSNLERGEEGQLGLFSAEEMPDGEGDPIEDDRSRTLTSVVDNLRERFGDDAIVPARLMRSERGDRR